MPDWIAWSPQLDSYVLCEAKGRLSGSGLSFVWGCPACVRAGRRQFSRVAVHDALGRSIPTVNWVAANLWSTDRRRRGHVSLLWGSDAEVEGERLSGEERQRHASTMRNHRVRNITEGLGHPGFPDDGPETPGPTVRISAQWMAPDEVFRPVQDDVIVVGTDREPRAAMRRVPDPPSEEGHEDSYVAAIITRFGVRPVLTSSDMDAARATRERSIADNEPALIYGFSGSALAGLPSGRAAWVSDNGIACPDGAGLFDLRRVEIDA